MDESGVKPVFAIVFPAYAEVEIMPVFIICNQLIFNTISPFFGSEAAASRVKNYRSIATYSRKKKFYYNTYANVVLPKSY
jgi:hypothetical protein